MKKSTNFAPSDIPELTPASQLINSADLETPEQTEIKSAVKDKQLTFMTDAATMGKLKTLADLQNAAGMRCGKRKITINVLLNQAVESLLKQHEAEIADYLEQNKTALQKMREFKLFSLEQLADLSAVDAETITKLENRETVNISDETYQQLADALQIPVNLLR